MPEGDGWVGALAASHQEPFVVFLNIKYLEQIAQAPDKDYAIF